MKSMTVVYIDGLARGMDGAIEREVLDEYGVELVMAGCTTDDEVVAAAAGAPAIMNTMYWMDAALLDRLPGLQVIVRGGVGVDNIDVDAATARGIIVCNVTDYGFNEVANHAFAMLLALNRKIVPLDRSVRTKWVGGPSLMPHTGRIVGETLGLVSFGTIAQAVARRATGFDMHVVAYDPYVDPDVAAATGIELVGLDELLARSDYVSVHAPLTADTRGMIGAEQLELMKPSAYVILTSRGGVIDEVALADAVRSGSIAGAGIDVWDGEPIEPSHPLLQLDNVIASPHAAWYSQVALVELRKGFAATAADVLTGVMPHSVVNPTVLKRHALSPREPGATT